MNKLFKTLFIISLFCSLGCKKSNDTFEATGTLQYTSSLALDGCEWLIKIDSNYYHPDNLAEEDKVNNAKISISYQLLSSRYQCGIIPLSAANPGIPVINIKKLVIN